MDWSDRKKGKTTLVVDGWDCENQIVLRQVSFLSSSSHQVSTIELSIARSSFAKINVLSIRTALPDFFTLCHCYHLHLIEILLKCNKKNK